MLLFGALKLVFVLGLIVVILHVGELLAVGTIGSGSAFTVRIDTEVGLCTLMVDAFVIVIIAKTAV